MPPEIISYKTIGDVSLNMHITRPAGGSKHPAIVIFFCGSWQGFSAKDFYPQSAYFASRGAVCFCAEVRVKPVHGTTPTECVMDAKSAIRWVRSQADEYDIDPEKIVAYGSSAAGHVSACTALVEDFNDEQDDLNISAKPDACVLICAVLVVYHSKGRVDRFGGSERARALSPILNVTKSAPPCLLLHGDSDDVVVPEESILFKRRMDEANCRCDLILHKKEGHGHTGWFDGNSAMFFVANKQVDAFLVSLNFLSGTATIDNFTF